MAALPALQPGASLFFDSVGQGGETLFKVVLKVDNDDIAELEAALEKVEACFHVHSAKLYKGNFGDDLVVIYLVDDERPSAADASLLSELIPWRRACTPESAPCWKLG